MYLREIYLFILASVCACVCIYACMHVHVCSYVHAHVCACVSACIVHMCAYVYTHVCVCFCICTCMYIFVHMCVCIHMCTMVFVGRLKGNLQQSVFSLHPGVLGMKLRLVGLEASLLTLSSISFWLNFFFAEMLGHSIVGILYSKI